MANNKAYKCSNCGHIEKKWFGKCPKCNEYSTAEETTQTPSVAVSGGSKSAGIRAARVASGRAPQQISKVQEQTYARMSSGIGEFDRVLGGSGKNTGFVPGGVVLLAGPPGVGKSSLATVTAKKVADAGKKVLIISGEETEAQIAARAIRMNATSDNIYLLSESNLDNALEHARDLQPDLLFVDSMQTLISGSSESRVGSPSQVMEVATEVTAYAKQNNVPTIIIGHINKDGNVAGPQTAAHLVDAVLYFEANSDSPLRLLRGVKNRFGAVDEVGCFEHTEDGLEEVDDPSGFFLDGHADDVVGYATSVLVEGNRALPIEIQALVTSTALPNPRKISNGLDHGRVMMIQAILEKHGHLRLSDKDLYVSTTGGLLTKDSSIDLAIAAAIISSYKSVALPDDSVFLGETSLTGEIRSPRNARKRAGEAQRLGFNNVVMAVGKDDKPNKNTVSNIRDLLGLIGSKVSLPPIGFDDDDLDV